MSKENKEKALNRYFSQTEQYHERIDLLHGARYFSRYVGIIRPFSGHGKFLDIGCGTGWVVNHFSEAAFSDNVGVDISPSGMRIALHSSGEKGNNRFVVADARHLPFKNGSFAVAGALTFLEHSYTPIENLKEMIRVLRTDGKIVLCHTNFLSPFSPLVKTSFLTLLTSVIRNLFPWGGYKRFITIALKLRSNNGEPEFVNPSLDRDQIKDGMNFSNVPGVYFPSDPDAVYLVNPIDLVKTLRQLGVDIRTMTTWAAYKKPFTFINRIPYVNVIGPGCTIIGRKVKQGNGRL